MGQAPLRNEAGEPIEQAQVQDPRGGDRPGRRLRRRLPRGAGVQRGGVLLPGQPAPRAQHRRPGRDQRGEELPQRRRQHLSALLRHDQGRRLPVPRGGCLAALPGEQQHHRPVRRAGCAVRPRLCGIPRHPLVRRRPGLPHLLRPRPDRTAAPAGRLLRHLPPDQNGIGEAFPANRDARPRGGRRRGEGDHRPQSRDRRDPCPHGRRGRARFGRIHERLLPVDERHGLQRHGDLEGPQERRVLREPVLHADPPHLHPAGRRLPVEADPHVRVASQRRPDLGTEEEGGLRQAGQPDRRGRPGLLPRAEVPELREPRPPGHLFPRGEGAVRRRARRRPRRARASTSISATRSSGSAKT